MAAESDKTPSLSDVMSCLRNIEGKLCNTDKTLDALEEVKQEVDRFDNEIKKLWVTLEDKNRKVADRVSVVEDKIESSDFALGMLSDNVIDYIRKGKRCFDAGSYLFTISINEVYVICYFQIYQRFRLGYTRMLRRLFFCNK
jgi:hypothetical protein